MLYSINITMLPIAGVTKVRLMDGANLCLFFAGFEKLYIAVDTRLDVADTTTLRIVARGSWGVDIFVEKIIIILG